jgi:anaerobic magnesium-protoporphyrin IX monomethyl ester cyclase
VKLALVNPPWSFDGSIYFGCREPHLPLELGYAKALLEREGHEVLLVDAQLGFLWGGGGEGDETPLDDDAVRKALVAFQPDVTVITTAPSYLFWRCAPPELRVPMRTVAKVRDVAGRIVAVGPHASTTPHAALRKLGADLAVLGECEDVLVRVANAPFDRWFGVEGTAHLDGVQLRIVGGKNATEMRSLPSLTWPAKALARHCHHHHRFDRAPDAPGAEIEWSRGCPYHCTFCAKDNFRDAFRKRPLENVLAEIDDLVAKGVRYVYFIDEIFVPDKKLLEALTTRDVQFGCQMRIDNWNKEMLELLGKAGCVSIEAGMESVTEKGRSLLAKKCKLSTEELTDLLVHAKKFVPFVQANLLDATYDPKPLITKWREHLQANGVWANEPVPLFPYPGSPEYTQRWGTVDERAWERAHEHYLEQHGQFSDIQETRPVPLPELERMAGHG